MSHWRRPATPLSIRKILREENPGWLGLVVAFFGLATAEQVFIEKTWEFEPLPAALAGFAVVACLVLRTLKKRSSLLCDRAAVCSTICFSATNAAPAPDNCDERSMPDAESLAEAECRM